MYGTIQTPLGKGDGKMEKKANIQKKLTNVSCHLRITFVF